MIRSKKRYYNQALVELNILTYIRDRDVDNNIVRLIDFVVFRKHLCLIFELLSINLYELLKINNFCGMNLEIVRRFSI